MRFVWRVEIKNNEVQQIIDTNRLKKLTSAEIRKIKNADFSLGNFPISPDETMLFNGGVDNYYFHGKSALNIIEATLKLVYRQKSEIRNILDFACGYGRVLRGLRTYFPNSRLYASDLEKKGVDFCSSVIGANGVYSDRNLNNVNYDTKFDLIWCSSLLTHVKHLQWSEFFNFFDKNLEDNGLIIFTYAGSFIGKLLMDGENRYVDTTELEQAMFDYDNYGYGYMNYKVKGYSEGQSFCSSSWVRSFLDRYQQYRTVIHMERGWGARQDVIVVIKEA